MTNNLPPTLEKKLLNRNAPMPNNDRSFTGSHSYHHDTAGNRRALTVGQGIRIQGSLEEVETLIIEGTVDTTAIKTKKIIIQKTGLFRGEVDAQDVEISGTLEGDILVQGNLTVTSTGRLLGKAKCRRLKVEDGGHITGQVEMITTDKLKPTPSQPEINNNNTQKSTNEKSSIAEKLLQNKE